MANKTLYQKSFELITQKIKQDYNVEVKVNYKAQQDFWLPGLNTIVINGNRSWKRRVNFLLHEIGHVINDNAKGPIAKSMVMHDYSSSSRSKLHFVSVVNEELRAWNSGKEFAIKNSFPFCIVSYNNDTTNCVMSYVKYGLQNVYGNDINIDYINIK